MMLSARVIYADYYHDSEAIHLTTRDYPNESVVMSRMDATIKIMAWKHPDERMMEWCALRQQNLLTNEMSKNETPVSCSSTNK